MNCLERRDLCLLYLTDGLEAAETAELRAHLTTGCPTCTAALAEAQATLDLLPHALDPQVPPPTAWNKLARRIAASAPPTQPARTLWRAWAPALALAASLLILITGISFWMQARQAVMPIAADTQMITLADASEPHTTYGRIFLSLGQKRCQLALDQLPPPPVGRTYELWIITTAGAKIPAGTFGVDASGKVAFTGPMPDFVGQIAAAAITDEPPGGVLAPTGSIRVIGNLK